LTTAPNNEAFLALGQETLDSLKLPENSDTLAGILLGHVVDGAVTSLDLVKTYQQLGKAPSQLGTETEYPLIPPFLRGRGRGQVYPTGIESNIYRDNMKDLATKNGASRKSEATFRIDTLNPDMPIEVEIIDDIIKLTVVGSSNSAATVVPLFDVMACNGYIHTINKVLLPPKPETSSPSRKPTRRPTPRPKSSKKAKGRKSSKSKAPKKNHNMFD